MVERRGQLVVHSFLQEEDGVVRGCGLQQVSVDWDPVCHAMQQTDQTKKEIAERWVAATSANHRLFNQSKFRLAGAVTGLAGGGVSLQVGLTDYRDHVGSNLVSRGLAALPTESADTTVSPPDMAQCIGVGAWLLTTDTQLVLVETAAWKGEGACMVDRPGGHAEPDEAGELSGAGVALELFSSIGRELRDELNIPLELQEEPELLGAVYNLQHGGRVTLDFLVKVRLSSQEVTARYTAGGQAEADESTGLVLVAAERVLVGQVEPALAARFTPHTTGSITLCQRRLTSADISIEN